MHELYATAMCYTFVKPRRRHSILQPIGAADGYLQDLPRIYRCMHGRGALCLLTGHPWAWPGTARSKALSKSTNICMEHAFDMYVAGGFPEYPRHICLLTRERERERQQIYIMSPALASPTGLTRWNIQRIL